MQRNRHSSKFKEQALSKARQRGSRTLESVADELNLPLAPWLEANRLERSDMFKLATATVLLAACLATPAHADPCALSASAITRLQNTMRNGVPAMGSPMGRLRLPASLTLVDATGRPCTVSTSPPNGGDVSADVGLGTGRLSAQEAKPTNSLGVAAPSLPLTASATLAGAATQHRSRAIDLGTFGGGFSIANAINDRDEVVGNSALPDFTAHAFLWRNGTMQDLGTLGGSYSEARGINNHGQVVGIAYTANEEAHAFLWEGGTMFDLGTLGGTFSIATAINDEGQVVGGSATAGDAELHAFIWSKLEGMKDMGSLGGGFSFVRGVNSRGQAVGTSHNAAFQQHAFLWQRQRGVDLGTLPGGSFADAAAINSSGVVVGVADTASFELHAFTFKQGTWTDLGSPVPGSTSEALGINDDGEVVGAAYFNGGVDARAVLWNRRGVPTDLNTLVGGDYSVGLAINSKGHVAGGARFAGSSEFHAFLLRR